MELFKFKNKYGEELMCLNKDKYGKKKKKKKPYLEFEKDVK